MAGKPRPNRETPERVIIKTALTQERVDGYWQTLNMSEETWLNTFSPAQRYEAVIDDLLRKLDKAEEKLKRDK
jgi:hypothetical protein